MYPKLYKIKEEYDVFYRFLIVMKDQYLLLWSETQDSFVIDTFKEIPTDADLKQIKQISNKNDLTPIIAGNLIENIYSKYMPKEIRENSGFNNNVFISAIKVFEIYEMNKLEEVPIESLLTHPSVKIRNLIKQVIQE